jgi:hypothetical protein
VFEKFHSNSANIHGNPQAEFLFAGKFRIIRIVYTRERRFRGNKLIDRSPSRFQAKQQVRQPKQKCAKQLTR